jgi:hypothetical protein
VNRTRQAKLALWFAMNVLSHIYTLQRTTATRLVIDRHGRPMRDATGRLILDKESRLRFRTTRQFRRLYRWGVERDIGHVWHWYYHDHEGCAFLVECLECSGYTCLCENIEGPGIKKGEW